MVPQLATASGDQYNRLWTFRQYELAEGRAAGVQRLAYYKADTVSALPGPDVKKVKPKLGMTRPISDLYEHEKFVVQPEYICLAFCLEEGRFGGQAVSSISAAQRSRPGRCPVCVRNKKSRHMCRIVWKHTTPA